MIFIQLKTRLGRDSRHTYTHHTHTLNNAITYIGSHTLIFICLFRL